MLREGEVIGIMTAIEKIFRLMVIWWWICFVGRKNIFRFHHCGKHMDGYFEMGYLERE